MRTSTLIAVLVVATLALAAVNTAHAKKDPKECEVCKKVVQDIFDSVPKEDRKSRDAIETAIAQHCKKGKDGAFRKGLSSKEKKACYYIYDIKRKVSDPLARGVPADRVCKKLKKANSELCEMRFPVKVDKNTDYSKLRVKQLKAILADRGVACKGCLEKRDYIKRVKETDHMEL